MRRLAQAETKALFQSADYDNGWDYARQGR